MKFEFIRAEKAFYPITLMCRILAVSRPGYYAWCNRPQSPHERRDTLLRVQVRASYERSRKTYGSPRICEELCTAGEQVSRKRVVRLMREQGLVARRRKRFKCTTNSKHAHPIAANILDQKFTASIPNERWVCDTTELLVGENGAKIYLAAVMDLFARLIVGWALSRSNDRHLTMDALDKAIRRRKPGKGLLHHSDQGSTYASDDYQNILKQHGITCSMSRRGNCFDNAAMESWFSTFKAELGEHFDSDEHAKNEAFDYIEVFYNQQRIHSSLDYVSPAEFEKTASRATGHRNAKLSTCHPQVMSLPLGTPSKRSVLTWRSGEERSDG